MNKVVLIGRATRDPELRYTSTNIPNTRFTLAVNRNFQNQNHHLKWWYTLALQGHSTGEHLKMY